MSTRKNVQRERVRRYLRDNGFGCLQNSVWINPDYARRPKDLVAPRCAAAGRESWRDTVTNDPLLPGRILPSDYLGQHAWRRRVEAIRAAGRQLRMFKSEKR